MCWKKVVCAALIALGSSTGSQAADILYSSPAWPNIASGYSALCSECTGHESHVYDKFTLSLPSNSIGSVDVALANYVGSNWNIDVTIWDAMFATKIYDRTFAPGEYTHQSMNLNVDKFSIPLPGVPTLAAGTYYMGWHDTDLGVIVYYGANTFMTTYDGYGPSETSGGAAFAVSAVPEPEIYAMMVAGLGFLGFVGRRRNQTT